MRAGHGDALLLLGLRPLQFDVIRGRREEEAAVEAAVPGLGTAVQKSDVTAQDVVTSAGLIAVFEAARRGRTRLLQVLLDGT